MYCTQCGTRNDDSATTCTQCGSALRPPAYGTPVDPLVTPQVPPVQAPGQPQYQPAPIAQGYSQQPVVATQIPNYLIQAILVTVFCCLPFGIVSIIFAAQVNSKAIAGDIAGAMNASKQAKTFAWIAFGIGAAGVVCYGIFMMLIFVGAIASGTHAH